jgi:hypothetical protein
MDTDKKTMVVRITIFAVVVLGIVVLMSMVGGAADTSAKYDSFAQCLSQKGVKFYGAFWCPHCQAQKKMFGGSVKYLPYIECSTPDGSSQNQTCNTAGISGYPTWEFPDGTRTTGEQSFQTLADKSGCQLPSGITGGGTTSGGASSAK